MALRTAFSQARIVTIGVLAALLWLVVAGLRIFDSIDFWGAANAGIVGDAIGATTAGGVLGLLIIGVTLLLIVNLLGELGETDPTPDTWPPRE